MNSQANKQLDFRSRQLVLSILERASHLTLASLRSDGSPHASTVSFASDGLIVYVAIALDSHKAHDVCQDSRVGLTINAPVDANDSSWMQIQGMSIDAHATLVRDPVGLKLASALLLTKLPGYASLIAEPEQMPWPGMLFVRIAPLTIQLLDYTRGFGHTDMFDIDELR